MGSIPVWDSEFFFVPRSCHCWKIHFHYLSPSLKKFTIFIIYNTLDDFDIADPSRMQDACHIIINLVYGPAHNKSLVAQLVRAPNWYLGGHGFDSCRGLRIFLCPMLVLLLKNSFLSTIWYSPRNELLEKKTCLAKWWSLTFEPYYTLVSDQGTLPWTLPALCLT